MSQQVPVAYRANQLFFGFFNKKEKDNDHVHYVRPSTILEHFCAAFIKAKTKKHDLNPGWDNLGWTSIALLSERNARLLDLAANLGYIKFREFRTYVIWKEQIRRKRGMEMVSRWQWDDVSQRSTETKSMQLVTHIVEPTVLQYCRHLESYYYATKEPEFHEYVCTKENQPINSMLPSKAYGKYTEEYKLIEAIDKVI